MKQKWYFFTLAFFVLSTITLAVLLYQAKKGSITDVFATGNTDCKYQYLNPLRCEPELAKQKKEYVALRNELLGFIEETKQKKSATHVSVYFRDLQNGPIMSIGGQENFAPASLLKVPLMVMYYKKAETENELLQRKNKIIGNSEAVQQDIKPEKTIEVGKTYNIDELINVMITHSDNTAWHALLADLRQQYSEEDFVITLSDLGIIDPRAKGEQYVTVQAYASIFRILYNSSYLNLEMSNKALELLSQSTFNDGLVAGVPEGIKVAHKFGINKDGAEIQLHDCGIVYFPDNPYLLCVMTRGDSIPELQSVIAYISKDVYEEVSSRQ
jgi:beta-lactamase class A